MEGKRLVEGVIARAMRERMAERDRLVEAIKNAWDPDINDWRRISDPAKEKALYDRLMDVDELDFSNVCHLEITGVLVQWCWGI